MFEVWNQSWFWPSVIVIVGLPLVLLVLTEWREALLRRGSPAARIVLLLRNYVAPTAALLVLLSQTHEVDVDANWSRIVATILGFLVILVLINGLNFALFVTARKGTWRERLPSIFVDVVRFLVIVVSIAILFSWVWGADVGGLFTALGIGSIVIGLALQNAVGGVLAGLLLLFEQPFQLGDWLQVDGVRGRVEEVNWRAVHIRTTKGVEVIPNSQLAGSGFTNLSRKASGYTAAEVVRFTPDDPPQAVIDVLVQVAADLPQRLSEAEPEAVPLDDATFEVDIPLAHPGQEFDAVGEFRKRIWYASRRAGLHLDRSWFDAFDTSDNRAAALAEFGALLRCAPEVAASLESRVRMHQFAGGETIQHRGRVPDGVHIIVEGTASMVVPAPNGVMVLVTELGRGDFVGLSSLTRQGINASIVAQGLVSCLFVPVAVVDELVDTSPELARDFGQEIDNRRVLVLSAFQEAGLPAPEGSRVLAF